MPPTATLTATPTSGPAPLSVTFDASTSIDTDGTIISYFWDFGDSTSQSGVAVTHVYAPGTYTAQLLVTDDRGDFTIDSVVITATNVVPTASFTATPSTGPSPLTVSFNGGGSSDPDGSITSYAWDFGALGTGTGQTLSRVFPPGVFTARLTVTDNNGATATTTRTITVSGAPAAPTGLSKTGQGCCDTYGDFAWNPVVGADQYEIYMEGFFLGGCVTDHSDQMAGPSSGRVQAAGLCLGSQYRVKIRARANGTWGPWSPNIDITL